MLPTWQRTLKVADKIKVVKLEVELEYAGNT